MKKYIIISIVEHQGGLAWTLTKPIKCSPESETHIKNMIERRDIKTIMNLLKDKLSPEEFTEIQPVLNEFKENMKNYHQITAEIFACPEDCDMNAVLTLGKQILSHIRRQFVFSNN